MQHLRQRILAATLPFLFVTPAVFAQQPTPPTRAEAAAALNPAPDAFTPPQLDQMLAPIALYPDKLLVTVLMAATFPPQIVEAGKWLQDPANAALKGDDLVAALEPLPWDPSVKSLVPFPQIVTMLNDHLDWTESLGAAFANQQVQAMARVQFLRERAVASGGLKSTPQLAVSGGSSMIVIEPVNPAMVYVPYYNPAEAYGAWPYRDRPPIYIPPPPDYGGGEIGRGIGVAVGVGVVGALWGWDHPDWGRHEVVVDQSRFTGITNPTNTANNHIVIQNDTWHRTAPFAGVPEPSRPHPASPPGSPLRGTVASTAVARPGPAPGPGHPPGAEGPAGQPGEPHPAALSPPPAGPEERRPGDAQHPPGAEGPGGQPREPHPAALSPPGAGPEQHRDVQHGPGAEGPGGQPKEPHPAEARPSGPPGHPADVHPSGPQPQPAQAHPPGPQPGQAQPQNKPADKKPPGKPDEHPPGDHDPPQH